MVCCCTGALDITAYQIIKKCGFIMDMDALRHGLWNLGIWVFVVMFIT